MILNSEAWFSIFLTLKIIIVDIILLLTLGNLLIFYLYKEDNLVKKTLSVIIDLPLIFPPIATGFILLWLFRKNGVVGEYLNKIHINIIFNFFGLVVAGFIASLALYVKPLLSAVRQFPKNIMEASYVSGKSDMHTFLRIIMPNIKNTFYVSLLLAVAKILGEVGISLMIGGNIPFQTNTISLEIFTAVFNSDLKTALYLSMILLIISILLFILLKYLENKTKLKGV